MPDSWKGNDPYFIDDLRKIIKPTTAIDVGVGHGKIGRLVKNNCPHCAVTGYEIFPDYITPEIRSFYRDVHIMDFRKAGNAWNTDLIVFGDVIEHFNHSEAMDILDIANYQAHWIAIFTPLSYVQGAIDGNPAEAHRCIVPLTDLLRYNVVHYFKDLSVNIYYALIRGLP